MARQGNKRIILGKIKEYIKVLEENGVEVWRMYLFGSYASGSAAKHSDIDLAVFLNKTDIDGFGEDVKLMRLRRKVDLRIEPHAFARTDFRQPDPFIREIVTKGLRVA